MKGQIAFETLFLFLIIISTVSFISMLYLQTHNETVLYSDLRVELAKQANSLDEATIINGIDFSSNTNTLNITTTPNTQTDDLFEISAIQEIITKYTQKTGTTINFNTQTSS